MIDLDLEKARERLTLWENSNHDRTTTMNRTMDFNCAITAQRNLVAALEEIDRLREAQGEPVGEIIGASYTVKWNWENISQVRKGSKLYTAPPPQEGTTLEGGWYKHTEVYAPDGESWKEKYDAATGGE